MSPTRRPHTALWPRGRRKKAGWDNAFLLQVLRSFEMRLPWVELILREGVEKGLMAYPSQVTLEAPVAVHGAIGGSRQGSDPGTGGLEGGRELERVGMSPGDGEGSPADQGAQQ